MILEIPVDRFHYCSVVLPVRGADSVIVLIFPCGVTRGVVSLDVYVNLGCIVIHMRTNIDLDDELVSEAQRLTGIDTKKGVVHEALRCLVETRKRRSLLDLKGKIELAPGYDHKALREGRR